MRRATPAILVMLISAVASAQPLPDADPAQGPVTDASKLFEEGRLLAKDGKYIEACEKFTRSYELDRGVGTELNLADCQEHLGHFAEAWRLFDDAALQSTANPSRGKFARDRATALNSKVATVVIKIPDPTGVTLTISGKPVPAAAEIRKKVDAGAVEVVVISAGKPTFTKTDTAVAGEIITIQVPGQAIVQAPVDTHTEPPPDVVMTKRSKSRVTLAIALGGVGGASLVASLALGLTARSQYNSTVNDPNGQCTKTPTLTCTTEAASKIDHAQSLADAGTVFGIAAIALIAGGAVVYFTAPRETVVMPTATADSVGITVARRF